MTNKEKYKQAFEGIKPRDGFLMEVTQMEQKKNHKVITKIAASAAACILVIGTACTAYAANLGGIQRTMQLWIHGDQTQVTVEFDGEGRYSMDYVDANGENKQQSGGGLAFEPDGSERPLTEEELMQQITAPSVEYKEDGKVYVYWFDQVVDITDKFEDGVCYVKLVNEDDEIYMTIREGDGWTTSTKRFPKP